MDFFLRNTANAMAEHGIKWGSKTLSKLDYADDLNFLDESVSNMNKPLEVLRVQDAQIRLKTNVKKSKFLRLRIHDSKD